MSAFGKPQENDEDLIILDGMDEVDTNPWYVPKGDYEMQCTDIEKGISNSGNPKLVFTMSVLKPASKEASKDGIGKDLKIHAALTPQAMWKVRETLEALGVKCDKKKLQIKPSDIRGKKCIGTVVDNEYQGQTNSQIKRCTPLRGKK